MTATDDGWVLLDAPLRLGIQRTLRVPERGGPYPLPPALGRIRVWPVSALGPEHPRQAELVVPLHVHEAVWFQFRGEGNALRALKVAVGGVDALTGESWTLQLHATPQDYIVCPYQPWLDGFNVGSGIVRQFVAVPLGSGQTVEHQMTGADSGGITVACYRPTANLMTQPPARASRRRDLGVGAGGRIRQRIYPDPYGVEVWDAEPVRVTRFQLMEAGEFTRRSGLEVPPSPIDAATYSRFGLPWFELHDESRGEVSATPALSGLKPLQVGESDVSEPGAGNDPTTINRIPPRSRRTRGN
jgi:hypothetical protein